VMTMIAAMKAARWGGLLGFGSGERGSARPTPTPLRSQPESRVQAPTCCGSQDTAHRDAENRAGGGELESERARPAGAQLRRRGDAESGGARCAELRVV
jgi:hypothetical protein